MIVREHTLEVVQQQEGNSNPQYNIEYCNNAVISGYSYQLGLFRFNMKNDYTRTTIAFDPLGTAQLTGQLLGNGRYQVIARDNDNVEKLTFIGPEVLPSVDAIGKPMHITVNFLSYL